MGKAEYSLPAIEILLFSDEVKNLIESSGEWTGWYDLENPDQPTV